MMTMTTTMIFILIVIIYSLTSYIIIIPSVLSTSPMIINDHNHNYNHLINHWNHRRKYHRYNKNYDRHSKKQQRRRKLRNIVSHHDISSSSSSCFTIMSSFQSNNNNNNNNNNNIARKQQQLRIRWVEICHNMKRIILLHDHLTTISRHVLYNHNNNNDNTNLIIPSATSSSSDNSLLLPMNRNNINDDNEFQYHFIFPGGGIFFYWQVGCIQYLIERGYNIHGSASISNDANTQQQFISYTGASAGSLIATLTCCQVDLYNATALALQLANDANVWKRSTGLYGIWGDMIYTWLDVLLPSNAIDYTKRIIVPTTTTNLATNDSNLITSLPRLNIYMTKVPKIFRKEIINEFHNRDDLILSNMASVHIPLFLNGKLTFKKPAPSHNNNNRYRRYIDGSFLLRSNYWKKQYMNKQTNQNNNNKVTIIFDYNDDPKYKNKKLWDIVKTISPDGLYQMIDDGKMYCQYLEEHGYFQHLHQKQSTQ